jgi:hypothetical protein
MPAAGLLGLFGFSFDDPHERAASGALVNGLALNGFPHVLAIHLYLRSGSTFFSGGGGSIFSDGGDQPHLRQVA